VVQQSTTRTSKQFAFHSDLCPTSISLADASEGGAPRESLTCFWELLKEGRGALDAMKPAQVSQVTVLSNLNSQYVGPIGVGTIVNPQGCSGQPTSFVHLSKDADAHDVKQCHTEDESHVWVVFDTGSTNLWVSSDLCRQGACAKEERSRYNHLRSVTYKQPDRPAHLKIRFGTGQVTGPQAVDDFHVGPFSVQNQTFGMIEEQQGQVFEEVPFEGILGLAFPSMSAGGVTPFFDNVIKQQALARNQFSFYFSRDEPAANAIFWGGVDKSFLEGDITYFNVTDPHYWSLDLNSFQIGGEELLATGQSAAPGTPSGSSFMENSKRQVPNRQTLKAIVDTGTTFFTAETALFQQVMRRLPAGPCSTINSRSHPPILYRLTSSEGKFVDFTLTHEQYMVADGDDEIASCSPAFMRIDVPEEHGPAMILGEVFLRYYHSTFDRGDGSSASARVGFAKSQHGDEVLSRLKDLTQDQPAFSRKTQV